MFVYLSYYVNCGHTTKTDYCTKEQSSVGHGLCNQGAHFRDGKPEAQVNEALGHLVA